MKQPDLYYSDRNHKNEVTSLVNFVWRIRAKSEYSLWTLIGLVTSFLWFQNSIVSQNKYLIIYRQKIMSCVETLQK